MALEPKDPSRTGAWPSLEMPSRRRIVPGVLAGLAVQVGPAAAASPAAAAPTSGNAAAGNAAAPGAASTEAARLDRNRHNVMAFYDLMFNQCKPVEAIAQYAGATYIQHNPEVEDGKEGFIKYFEKMNRDYPGKTVEIKRAIAEGDYVVLHCRQVFPPDDVWAGIDIFRLDENGKVLEHWDVLQRVPRRANNPNGMF